MTFMSYSAITRYIWFEFPILKQKDQRNLSMNNKLELVVQLHCSGFFASFYCASSFSPLQEEREFFKCLVAESPGICMDTAESLWLMSC